MKPNDFMKPPGPFNQRNPRPGMFEDFDATELYCPRCRQSVPVRKRLLLVLPEGDKYEYLCDYCLEHVGEKMDRHGDRGSLII
ncbi:cytoplasmic protein [Thermodesulfobacteriota bacterium]